jgi:hypothetical protein
MQLQDDLSSNVTEETLKFKPEKNLRGRLWKIVCHIDDLKNQMIDRYNNQKGGRKQTCRETAVFRANE